MFLLLLTVFVCAVVFATNNGADVAVCNSRSTSLGCPPSKWPLVAGKPQRLKCSEPGRIMSWAAEGTQNSNYKWEFGPLGGTPSREADWNTMYAPDQWFEVRIITTRREDRYRGILLYVNNAAGQPVGEWSVSAASPVHLQHASLCKNSLLHAGAQEKPMRLVVHLRLPKGTGKVQFRALLKTGPANEGSFYWPGTKDPELNEGPVVVESAVPPPLRTNVTWVGSTAGQSCAAACAAAGDGTPLACNTLDAAGPAGPLTDRSALQAIGVAEFGCSHASLSVCSSSAPVRHRESSICYHASAEACAKSGLAPAELMVSSQFDCQAVAPDEYTRLCPCALASTQPVLPPTMETGAPSPSTVSPTPVGAPPGPASCTPGSLGCRCRAPGTACDSGLECADDTYCLSKDGRCQETSSVDKRGCLCALGNDESCASIGLKCWAPVLQGLDAAACVVAQCHPGLRDCPCRGTENACDMPDTACDSVDGMCRSTAAPCVPGTLDCTCDKDAAQPCSGLADVECVVSQIDGQSYCLHLLNLVDELNDEKETDPVNSMVLDISQKPGYLAAIILGVIGLLVAIGLSVGFLFKRRRLQRLDYTGTGREQQQPVVKRSSRDRASRRGSRRSSVRKPRFASAAPLLPSETAPSTLIDAPEGGEVLACPVCQQVYGGAEHLALHQEKRNHY